MSVADIRKGMMKSKGKYTSNCAGNPNMGGETANDPKIDNMDDEKGFINNSNHAIYRKKK